MPGPVAWVDVQANSLFYGQPIIMGGSSEQGDFFGIAGTGGENSGVHQYDLYIDHWGTVAYRSDIAVIPNQWNQVAMTYDGAETVSFYINFCRFLGFQRALQLRYQQLYDRWEHNRRDDDRGFIQRPDARPWNLQRPAIVRPDTVAVQSSVPEPSSLTLLGLGAALSAAFAYRRRKNAAI